MKDILVPVAAGVVIILITPLLTSLSEISRIALIILVILPFAIYWLWSRQSARKYPFGEYRVVTGAINNGESLIPHERGDGNPIGTAWQFRSTERNLAYIFGPYLRESLRRGRYEASFRLKIDNVNDDDRPEVDIDVISRKWKTLGRRTLTTFDFGKPADTYRDFALGFVTEVDESEVEFRVISQATGKKLTLDHVRLSKRAF